MGVGDKALVALETSEVPPVMTTDSQNGRGATGTTRANGSQFSSTIKVARVRERRAEDEKDLGRGQTAVVDVPEFMEGK